jgi:hypothetical protein
LPHASRLHKGKIEPASASLDEIIIMPTVVAKQTGT